VADLPYQQTLSEAAAIGRVLHREDIYGSGPPVTMASSEVVSLIMLHGGDTVLDVGCGIGVYVAALRDRGISACGIEVNADYVSTARDLNRDVALYDGGTMPFEDGSFDTAIAIEVLEHIPDWQATLREMLRVARRCVLISVPNIGVIPSMSRHMVVPWHLLEATHVNFFTSDILSRYLQNIDGVESQVFTVWRVSSQW